VLSPAKPRRPGVYLRRILRLCAALPCIFVVSVTAADCPDQPAEEGLSYLCGIEAPEDIVALDERYLAVSSMAPGRTLYVIDSLEARLSPMETVLSEPAAGRWGDPGCPLPAELVTHGLDIIRREDGALSLLAVNHGERESVEFFEVLAGAAGAPSLAWRGCVIAAEDTQFNDVAALPGGGFLATDPITASWQLPRMIMGTFGAETGRVYRWERGRGYSTVPNTEGAYPNGILLARDGRSFFLNLYLEGVVQQHDLESGEVIGSISLNKPDNSSWSPAGELLVASHGASVMSLLAAIASAPGDMNSIPFRIVAIDPADFSSRTVFENDGEIYGGGTIAAAHGGRLYIGTFRGDRVLVVKEDAAR
jgi:hypothetical protein